MAGRLDGKVALVTGGHPGHRPGGRRDAGGRGCGGGVHRPVRGRRPCGRGGGRPRPAARALYVRADNGVEEEVAGAVARHRRAVRLAHDAREQRDRSDDVGSGRDSHVDEIDNDIFDKILRIALMGTVWACEVRDPARCARPGSGSIVNISASSSKSALPHRPAYHASKGAINALTRQMAVDYGKDDIRANTIIVGFVFTGTDGDDGDPRQPADAGRVREEHHGPALRRAGRHRGRRRVPRVRRVEVRDRHRAHDRRRRAVPPGAPRARLRGMRAE